MHCIEKQCLFVHPKVFYSLSHCSIKLGLYKINKSIHTNNQKCLGIKP